MLQLTDNAIQRVREFRASNIEFATKDFRIQIHAGGCSGFTYDYSFDERRADDTTVQVGEVTIVIDPASLPMLQGVTLDYVEDFQGAGFTVLNPNSTTSCGCGKSFGV